MSWDFHSTTTNLEASFSNSTDALSTQRQTAYGLADARQVALSCPATQVGIDGHRDAQPTIATSNRPIEASSSGLTTTQPDDQDIPPGPPQRNGQPASDQRRTAQQTASHLEDTHPTSSEIGTASQGSSISTGALHSCVRICHSHSSLMPGQDRLSDEGSVYSDDSSSSGYSGSTMEQEPPTAKAEVVPEQSSGSTAKRQAKPATPRRRQESLPATPRTEQQEDEDRRRRTASQPASVRAATSGDTTL
eukprot:5049017-Amphidinium_carterae.1